MPDIKCPNCGHEFPLEDALNDEMKEAIEKEKQELRQQMVEYKRVKEEELGKKEMEWQQKAQAEKAALQKQIEESLRKNISADFENKVRMLEQNNKDNEEKLKTSRQKELAFLQKEQEFKNKEAELELTVQKKLQAEREKLSEELRRIEEQKVAARENEFNMKVKELEKQLDDQKKLADEMRRKAEQGSMQLQGEVQEVALEEILRTSFPFDIISEVGKGVRGADCIQIVRNNFGQECGKIIYESKRTKDFSNDWIEKLKADMRVLGADVALIVTQAFPKDMDRFGEKDGVWICSFTEVRSIVHMLRDGIIKISTATKSQENKGDKMHMLYDYLTSNEFAGQWKAIREGFMSMKAFYTKRKRCHGKIVESKRKTAGKSIIKCCPRPGFH
jgi:hypothetical protein